jgi:hypothetical protein
MSMVTILEKTSGSWSQQEVKAIVSCGTEVESLGKKPNRIVVMNKPLRGGTFQQILGHSDFVAKEVDYRDRWV